MLHIVDYYCNNVRNYLESSPRRFKASCLIIIIIIMLLVILREVTALEDYSIINN